MLIITTLLSVLLVTVSSYESTYKANYGSSAADLTESSGVTYIKDQACLVKGRDAYAISNIPASDLELYRNYCVLNQINNIIELPLNGSGRYILIIKFSPYTISKVTGVTLNEAHQLLHNYEKPSSNLIQDEVFVFNVCEDRLRYKSGTSRVYNSTIPLQFSSSGGAIRLELSALGLFKEDNVKALPIPTSAINFNRTELLVESKFECKGNQFVKFPTLLEIKPNV